MKKLPINIQSFTNIRKYAYDLHPDEKKHLCLPFCLCRVPNTADRETVGTVVAVVAVHGSVAIVEVPDPRVRTIVG